MRQRLVIAPYHLNGTRNRLQRWGAILVHTEMGIQPILQPATLESLRSMTPPSYSLEATARENLMEANKTTRKGEHAIVFRYFLAGCAVALAYELALRITGTGSRLLLHLPALLAPFGAAWMGEQRYQATVEQFTHALENIGNALLKGTLERRSGAEPHAR